MKIKILSCFAIFFCITIISKAQINEGRYLLGGSASFNSAQGQPYLTPKYESLYTNIQFGKVLKENTVTGLIFSYNSFNNPPSNKSYQLSGGVFYRKYKLLAKDLYFFGEGDAVYSHSKNNQGVFQIGNNAYQQTSNGGAISFTPGISYSIYKRMQIELLMPNLVSLSYIDVKTENTSIGTTSISTTKGHNFSANANLNSTLLNNFGIGFKFLLGK